MLLDRQSLEGNLLFILLDAARGDKERNGLVLHSWLAFVPQRSRLADEGALDARWTVEEATDILWSLTHPRAWDDLIGHRGWKPGRFVDCQVELAELIALGACSRLGCDRVSPTIAFHPKAGASAATRAICETDEPRVPPSA